MWQNVYKYLGTNIKGLFVLWTIIIGTGVTSHAQKPDIIDKVDAGRVGDSVQVYIHLDAGKLEQNRTAVLSVIPRIVANTDSVEMPAIHVLGRDAYYRYIRHDDLGLINSGDIVMWEKKRFHPMHYAKCTSYKPWMEKASLKLIIQTTDSCESVVKSTEEINKLAKDYVIDVKAKFDNKETSVSGRTTVVFPLSITKVMPEVGNNRSELNKIKKSIDNVRGDEANELEKLTIKGFASPEGPYKNNVRLAKERTKSLADYVAKNYNIDRKKITTSYEPEDWEGLLKMIREASAEQLPNKEALLELAESNRPFDERERLMRLRYPKDFDYILEHCLPQLRHSDYRIDFKHREMVEVVKARKDTLQYIPVFKEKYREMTEPLRTYDMLFALKTNLLFDVLLAPNIEVEVPLGKKNRWSVMAEYWTPWYVWRHNSRAYELQVWGVEARNWLGKCRERRPKLTGTFVGYYAAYGRYDFEWNSVGDQGDFFSAGVTFGHSWTIARHWNLEASISAGALIGERRHYNGEFNDTHLIWKYNKNLFYAGPTKAKISLVWMIGKKTKEGSR